MKIETFETSVALGDRPASLVYAGPPCHAMLAVVPATCFVGALLTDLVYWRSAEKMWADFSAWLVSAGVVLGWLFLIIGLIEIGTTFLPWRVVASASHCGARTPA